MPQALDCWYNSSCVSPATRFEFTPFHIRNPSKKCRTAALAHGSAAAGAFFSFQASRMFCSPARQYRAQGARMQHPIGVIMASCSFMYKDPRFLLQHAQLKELSTATGWPIAGKQPGSSSKNRSAPRLSQRSAKAPLALASIPIRRRLAEDGKDCCDTGQRVSTRR